MAYQTDRRRAGDTPQMDSGGIVSKLCRAWKMGMKPFGFMAKTDSAEVDGIARSMSVRV